MISLLNSKRSMRGILLLFIAILAIMSFAIVGVDEAEASWSSTNNHWQKNNEDYSAHDDPDQIRKYYFGKDTDHAISFWNPSQWAVPNWDNSDLYVCTDYYYYNSVNKGATSGGAVCAIGGEKPVRGNGSKEYCNTGLYSGWIVIHPRTSSGDYFRFFGSACLFKTGYTYFGMYTGSPVDYKGTVYGTVAWNDQGWASNNLWYGNKCKVGKDATGSTYSWSGKSSDSMPRWAYIYWKPNTYNISYNLNGGTLSNTTTKATYDYSFNVQNPTRDGYAFAGWTISGISTAPERDVYTAKTGLHGTLPSATIGNKQYYYDSGNAGGYNSKSGYTFASNGTVSGVFATSFKNLITTASATVTFTANWKKIEDKTETDSKQVITYAKSSYDKTTLFNITGKDAEYKYNNGKTSITGTATTPTDQIATSTNNVTYKVETIKRTTAYKYNPVTKQSYDYSYTYEATSPTWNEDSITYKTDNMLIEAEKYQPMNLVRGNNAWATSADCGEYATSSDGKLDINATDAGTKRTSPYFSTGSLVAIDNNSDTPLYLKFNNDTLGLPDEYNWHNESLAESIGNLENGTWEYSNPSLGYCNDRFTEEDSDGYFRYNLKFNAGLTTLSSTYPTASLISPNGDEVDASTALDSSYVSGNGWFIRFIQAGKYTTKSNTTGDFSNWWCDTYTIGKGYEYGTKYDYTLTTAGLEEPTNISHGHYANGAITVDAGTHERGLYVTCYSQDVVQPVLYCEWDVSTVASMYYG